MRKDVTATLPLRINKLKQFHGVNSNKNKIIAFTEQLSDVFREHGDEHTQMLDLPYNPTDPTLFM